MRDSVARAVEACERAATLLTSSPWRSGAFVRVPAQGHLLATGDLHDNPSHFRRILRLANLEAGPDRHVVLHELIHGERLVDGVDLSHRMLLRCAELVIRYPNQAHPLLANHEIAQLTGRGVSKGGGNSVMRYDDGLEYAFGDDASDVDAALKMFIRAMPLGLVSEPDANGRSVLAAHSIPGAASWPLFDAGVSSRELDDDDFAVGGAAYQMTWGRDLPPEHVAAVARRFGVSLLCLGHQHAETGVELLPPCGVVLNSDHERGCAIPVALDAVPTAEEAVMEAIPLAAISDPAEHGV